MKLNLKKVLVPLLLVFTLAAGCRRDETTLEQNSKPKIIDDLIENAIAKTDTGQVAPKDGADFKTRMNKILADCHGQDLVTLRDSGITVALDERMEGQQQGFFDSRIQAVYYPKEHVLSLWDNGKGTTSFWSGKDPYTYSEKAVKAFASDLRDGDIKGSSLYVGFLRGSKSHYVGWDKKEEVSSSRLSGNPFLQTAPLKAAQ